jgi:lipopolysaccharide biosynthesis protein
VKTDFVQNAVIQFDKQQNYEGMKVALIAHWDPQKIIDPYVFYYAENLKKFGYTIVLCSANEVEDIDNTNNCFDAVIYRKNSGYDFSSWKAAFTVLPSLFEANEILLTNDSFFDPIGDMHPFFSAMLPLKCDFWVSLNFHFTVHIFKVFLLFCIKMS